MAVGKFLDQLNTLTVATIENAADLFPIYDNSATEHKAIAAADVLKRWLSTTDVSWMTTLAVTGIDTTNDKFLVWDANVTAFKVITASDLLNLTLAGTSSAVVGSLNTWSLIESADYWLVFDTTALLWKKVPMQLLTSALAFSYGGAIVSTPTPIGSTSTGRRYSNYGAGAIIVLELPAATVGLKYAFQRITNFAIRVDPQVAETIGGGGAGKYLELTTRGATQIECFVAGAWEVTGGSSIYTFEA